VAPFRKIIAAVKSGLHCAAIRCENGNVVRKEIQPDVLSSPFAAAIIPSINKEYKIGESSCLAASQIRGQLAWIHSLYAQQSSTAFKTIPSVS
jgi:hypothetical protein